MGEQNIYVPLGDIILDMHQGINTVTENVDYKDDGVPIIQSKHITKGYLDLEDTRFLNEASYIKYREKYQPTVDDILVCNIGTIGNSLRITKHERFLIAWNLFLIKLDLSKVNAQYFTYYLNYLKEERKYFEQFLTGGTVKFINKKTMASIPVPLPLLHIQEQIANTLDKADALRKKDQELLQKFDELAQSIFYDMFGGPVRNNKVWKVVKIKDVGSVVTGSTPPSSKENMFGGQIPFITPGDLESDQPVQRFLTKEGAENSRTVPAKSTLVCCIGATIGKTGMTNVTSAFNQQINAIIWNNTMINPTFGTFMMGYFKKVFRDNFSSATTLPIINKSSFQNLEILCPDIELQNKFEFRFNHLIKLKSKINISFTNSRNLFSDTQQRFFS